MADVLLVLEDLEKQRLANASAVDRQLIVFSHYPSNWLNGGRGLGIQYDPSDEDFLDYVKLIRSSSAKVAYFGGAPSMAFPRLS